MLSRAFEGYLLGLESRRAVMSMSLQEKQNTGQELYRGSHACCHGQSGIKWKLRGETDQKRKGVPCQKGSN